MKSAKEILIAQLEYVKRQGETTVWYGHIEQAKPIDIDEAIKDIKQMDPDAIGDGTWGLWPE